MDTLTLRVGANPCTAGTRFLVLFDVMSHVPITRSRASTAVEVADGPEYALRFELSGIQCEARAFVLLGIYIERAYVRR